MKLNHDGATNSSLVGLVVITALLVASLIFGFWALSGRNKYKNDTDQLISTAVVNAKQGQQTTDNKLFALEEQKPLIQYVGPQAYGTINLYYPRTWSSYVNTTGADSYPVDGYFYPGTLPSVDDSGSVTFALRLQVQNEAYATILQNYESEVSSGQASVQAYALPKVPSLVGSEVVGQLGDGVSGTMVILPLRTETLLVWTEGSAYLSNFNNDILPNLTFSP